MSLDEIVNQAITNVSAEIRAELDSIIKNIPRLKEKVYEDIIDSFRMYSDASYIHNTKTIIDEILFEYPGNSTIPPGFETMGYAYSKKEEAFGDCGGFDLTPLFSVCESYYEKNGDTKDYQYLDKACKDITNHILENILEKACKTAEFENINKAPSVYFLIAEQDFQPQIIYTYSSSNGRKMNQEEKQIRKSLKETSDGDFEEAQDFFKTVKLAFSINEARSGENGLTSYTTDMISASINYLLINSEQDILKRLFYAYINHLSSLKEEIDKNNKGHENICAYILSDYYKDKKLTKKVFKLLPKTPTLDMLAFNIACIQNVNNNTKEALLAISQSYELGVDKQTFLNEPMLSSFNGNDDFENIFK